MKKRATANVSLRVVRRVCGIGVGLGILSACAMPTPPLLVMPGKDKTYAEFQADEAACHGQVASAPAPTTKEKSNIPPPPNLAYAQCMVTRHNIAQPGTTVVRRRVYVEPGYAYAPYGDPWMYGGGMMGFGY